MNTIRTERVQMTLNRLYLDSRSDIIRTLNWIPSQISEFFQPWREVHSEGVEKRAKHLRENFLGITKEQGDLLYTLVRLKQPDLVVEFGASMGISTLYLGSALQDNGHGEMITTELEPGKCERVRSNLGEAGLDNIIEVREGDARETLKDLDRNIDFLFLDGWKALYLPVLAVVEERLLPGSTVLADDTRRRKKQTRPFVTHMVDSKNGYITVDLKTGHGMSLSVRK